MRNILLISLFALGFSSAVHAQDFGLTAGLSVSGASSKTGSTNSLPDGSSTNSVFGFRAGGVMSIPLADQFLFRSGLIFSQRHVEVKLPDSLGGNKATINYDYIDIPLLAQFNFNENFGVFGGLVAAANVNHSSAATGYDVSGTKTLYPLVQIGVNATFQNQFGVEAYYEYGIGDISDVNKNFSVIGANFIYWL